MIGRTILHYRILRMLGAGGMGVVYEAEDLKLHRLVALKFLPPELAGLPMALERLQREARAASNLTHPNIATVYAIEQAETEEGECLFIAMERLDGQPLDRLIGGQPLAVDVALEIGVQVADALDAAHARGIIHRDIKPANIFVQPRHRVKVLDFGLAKTAANVGMTETMEAERAEVLTSPGTTLGTIAYMSPEQARGEELDARTDLFSFGAVLYEMCTGHAPFGGRTSAVIFQKILDKEPAPLREVNPSLPPRLEEIVAKALEKDRDLRCQTAAELRADLRRLQRDTTSGRGTIPAASGREPVVVATPPPSSGAMLVAEARRHKLGLGVGAVVLVALLIAAGFGIFGMLTGNTPVRTSVPSLTITPLTTSGDIAGCTSISPDGRHVVYCDTDRTTGAATLRIRQVASGATIKLADGGGATTFSPDGDFVYLRRTTKEYPDGALFVLPSLGGEEPQRVLTGINGPVAVSPDGRALAFVRGPFIKQSIVIAPRDGSAARPLLTLTGGPTGAIGTGMSWSPDGQVIAVAYRSTPRGLMAPAAIDVATGKLRRLTEERWRSVNRVAWLHDGKALVFSAALPGATNNQLWLLSYPDGQVQRITNDLHEYAGGAFGVSDDDTIAIAQYVDAGDLWISDPAGGNPTRIVGGTNPDTVIGWTRDGRIVYVSAAPIRALWTVSPDGGAPRRLPVDLTDIGSFAMAPGQDWLAYTTSGTTSNIGRVDLDGGNRRQLTHGGQDQGAHVTPDGAWVLYARWESGTPSIWKVPSAGGSPVRLSERTGRPLPAPDGRRYCAVILADDPQDQDDPRRGMGIFRVSDGGLESAIKVGGSTSLEQFLRGGRPAWAPHGDALVYIRTEGTVGNLWTFPLDGSGPSQLTRFDSERLFSYAFSPDGKRLATSRGRNTGDLVLIRNFR